MTHWYAVYTQPRNETVASQHLERQGFEVLLPLYLKRRSHARRIEMVPAPLFPRYLFVSFDARQAGWRTIRSTRGVIDLVRNGLDPVPVSEAIIEELRDRRDEQGYVVLAKHFNLKRGSRIRIDDGPFAGLEAIFESQRDEERVVALLSLLGREVMVQLPIRAVMPA
jgi:transcriptional antiterminator RfaH